MTETDDERLRRGRAMLDQADPQAGDAMINDLRGIAPDFERFLLGFVFADIYDRPTLTLRERQLVRLGVLAGIGAGPASMRANISSALNNDVPQAHIVEAFLQCLPYAGFPRVIEALHTAKELFAEADTPP